MTKKEKGNKYDFNTESIVKTLNEVEMTTYVHKETGEIQYISSICHMNEEGQRVEGLYIEKNGKFVIVDKEKEKELKEKWKEEKVRQENIDIYKYHTKKRGFVQFDKERSKDLEFTLSPAERNYYCMLTPYVSFNGEPMQKKGIGKLTIKEVSEIWGLDRKAAGNYIRKFIKEGIIKAVENIESKRYPFYTTTGDYFFKGEWKDMNDFTVKSFQDTMGTVIERLKEITDKHLEKNPKSKSIYPLSVLNAIIPYVHFETSFVLKNHNESILMPGESVNDALERKPEALKHMVFSEIRRKAAGKEVKKGEEKKGRLSDLGLDTKTLNLYFDWLEEIGAILFIGSRKNRKLLVHPDLVFISPDVKDDDWIRSIKNIFKQSLL